jgi:hypothetical protein
VKPAVRASTRPAEPSISPPGQLQVDGEQRGQRHHQAHQQHAQLHLAVDHPVGELAWRAAHHLVRWRVDPYGQRRTAVGQQVRRERPPPDRRRR